MGKASFANDDWNGLFARPVDRKVTLPEPPRWPVSTGTACIACLGALVTLVGAALPNDAQDRPTSSSTLTTPKSTARSTDSIRVARNDADTPAPARRPVTFYTDDLRPDLFGAPPPVHKPAPLVVRPITTARVTIIAPPPDPFAEWRYTGTVKIGNHVEALIENRQTKEGQYLGKGARFLGATVGEITDESVTFNANGSPRMLSKAEITVTPFDRSASGVGGPTQPAAPAFPFQTNPAVPAVPDANALSAPAMTKLTLPSGAVVTPRRFRKRALDGGFNRK